MHVFPCHLPELCDIGARRARLATCFPPSPPISGLSTRIMSVVVIPMPGMLDRMSSRSCICRSCLANANMAVSILSISHSIWRGRLASCTLKSACVTVALRALAVARSFMSARRAHNKSLRSYRLSAMRGFLSPTVRQLPLWPSSRSNNR